MYRMHKARVIKYTPELLRRLQLTQLEILVEFDRVCRKNDIRYFLACGTLLGAIRHKGFIPWDDDIDVWMLRDDYTRFCDVCDRDLGEGFFFQNWDIDPHFNSAYGKLRKKNTRYIRAGQEKMKYKDGIYMDILPLDNVPDNYWLRARQLVLAWLFRKLTYAKAGAMCERSITKRGLYFLLSIYPSRVAKRQFYKIITRYDKKNTLYCKCLGDVGFNAHWRDDFKDVVEWEFEGYKFWVPVGYDSVLKKSIGIDYMCLPPIEERKPHAEASYISFGD